MAAHLPMASVTSAGMPARPASRSCQIVAACALLAWTQMLALDGTARRWEPRRHRLFSAAGRLARGGRRLRVKISSRWPWATQITAAITRLQALAPG